MYTVIIFFSDGRQPWKWKKVVTLWKVKTWLDREGLQWLYFNVYDHTTGTYLRRVKPSDWVGAKVND